MIRRIALAWPDPHPFRARDGRPIRLLATSDELDPALDVRENREAIGPIDLVVGCGDLSPDRLGFLADAFCVPLVYLLGNHDRGGQWLNPRMLPDATSGIDRTSLPELPMLFLPWPGDTRGRAHRDDGAAWRQAVHLAAGMLVRPPRGCLVLSHVPPLDIGDTPTDPYHRGFAAYRFLLDRIAPPLWLHGHTALAACAEWRTRYRSTVVANVTGTVVVEIAPPGTPLTRSGPPSIDGTEPDAPAPNPG